MRCSAPRDYAIVGMGFSTRPRKEGRKSEGVSGSAPAPLDVDAIQRLLSGTHLPPVFSLLSLDSKSKEIEANILPQSGGTTVLPPARVDRLVHSMQGVVNSFARLSSWLLPAEELEYSSRPDPHKMRPCRARDSLLKLPPIGPPVVGVHSKSGLQQAFGMDVTMWAFALTRSDRL